MGALEGRVVVITGAARGMGREHALLCAAEGARVVVNDLGCAPDGTGSDPSAARAVADEITALGGEAVANNEDVADADGARGLVDQTVDMFGTIDVLVNNAGILRDKMFVNIEEEDFDAVIRGHLKAVFCPTRAAAAFWRARAKAEAPVRASVISMSSTSGLIGQVGQSSYGAAKAAIAALTVILADELGRYGVRVNALTPVARTRMTEDVPGIAELVRAPAAGEFDVYHPGNVSPLVAWLATDSCPVTGRVFYVKGGEVGLYTPWHHDPLVAASGRWTLPELEEALAASRLVALTGGAIAAG
jgi:NAD(P)-dependent dehydrogenase (short-subunit alcohol dehydrogenase family)